MVRDSDRFELIRTGSAVRRDQRAFNLNPVPAAKMIVKPACTTLFDETLYVTPNGIDHLSFCNSDAIRSTLR
uniref:Restriction endonuclease subunit S n=1 Tax=Angiostrongylus cantonensis TaxID=6313 RepID=A0A0K0DA59_ANGCA